VVLSAVGVVQMKIEKEVYQNNKSVCYAIDRVGNIVTEPICKGRMSIKI